MSASKIVKLMGSLACHNKGGKYAQAVGIACWADAWGRHKTVDGHVVPADKSYPQHNFFLTATGRIEA